MTRSLFGLFIHGVGEQSADFASEARANLRRACGERDVGCSFESVHWAPLADRAERAYLDAVKRKGSAGRPLQELTIGTLADALMYTTSPDLQRQIFRLLDQAYSAYRSVPLVIFAHSLGGLLVTDWLRMRPEVRRVQLVTFGCNIGLFTLGTSFKPVAQVAARGSWLNLWDKQDMLGYPLAVAPELAHVRDVQVNVGSWLTRWNGLSHTAYWDDRKLWRTTIPELLTDSP